MKDRLSALPADLRTVVICAMLRDGPRAERILMFGPRPAECAEAARFLADLDDDERNHRLATELALLASKVFDEA
jgi:hypothetical protein